MLAIGIIGASGYTGVQLVKLAKMHPKISHIELYGYSQTGINYSELYPELGELNLKLRSIETVSLDLDVYFLALPHTQSIGWVEKLYGRNALVIDLSADFRLNSAELYEKVYGKAHSFSHALINKRYGLTEHLSDEELKKAHVIANPGCFPTVTLLALKPISEVFEKHIEAISTIAYSGTSGAGKNVGHSLSCTEMFGNTKAYAVLSHRHQPEIEQELNNGYPYNITMHLLPVSRGIYATHTIFLKQPISEEQLLKVYNKRYLASTFVRLCAIPPELKWVVGTNYCDLHIRVVGQVVVITSCIDNLIKGASGQAVQNMNLHFGFNEAEGLTTCLAI